MLAGKVYGLAVIAQDGSQVILPHHLLRIGGNLDGILHLLRPIAVSFLVKLPGVGIVLFFGLSVKPAFSFPSISRKVPFIGGSLLFLAEQGNVSLLQQIA